MADFVKLDKEKKEEEPKKPKWFSFKVFIIAFIVFMILSSIISGITYSITPKIAVVEIKGPILTDGGESILYGSSQSSRDTATDLYNILNDDSVKGVILDINSPGGSPVASEEISIAIEKLKEEKPVYALINDVGASGAFWIAMSADKVYSSKMSQIGSIGVTSAGLSFEDFIKDWNITYRKQTAGDLKDIGSPYREPTEEEEKIIQDILDEIHKEFILHVAKARNMEYEKVKEYATGVIFLGSKGLEAGFVDEIGYYPDVLKDMRNEVGNETIVVKYGPTPTFLEELGAASNNGIVGESENKILLR